MPGLPRAGGYLFVFDSSAAEDKGFTIEGGSSCERIYYAALMPGAVLAQGEIPVVDGKWQYAFDPVAMNKAAPIYDLSNPYSGKQDESRLVHLSFFGLKKDAEGRTQGYVDRVIIRGREVISAR